MTGAKVLLYFFICEKVRSKFTHGIASSAPEQKTQKSMKKRTKPLELGFIFEV